MAAENTKAKPSKASGNDVNWSSKFGFLMAAIGSAVGLGNIWRFPYMTGQNGGGAFVVVYILATLLLALPLLICEIMLGRAGHVTPVMTMRKLIAHNKSSRWWVGVGWAAVFCSSLVLSYYSVIGGWTIKYAVCAMTGSLKNVDHSQSALIFSRMTGSVWTLTFYHGLFMLLTMLIVVGGIKKGIENSVVIMMPMLFIVLSGLVLYAATMPGFWQGWHFLFDFKFKDFGIRPCLDAIGQAFYALSVGLGAMMTYGGYLGKSENIIAVSFKIALADTLVAILAGLAIFPIIFSYGLLPAQGPGLTFISLPIAFGQMTGGAVFASAFFILLFLAALTSSVSVLEVPVSCLMASCGMSRAKATFLAGCFIWLLGLLTVLSFNFLSHLEPLSWLGISGGFFRLIDLFVSNVLLLGIGLSIALYGAWVLKPKVASFYLGTGEKVITFRLWRFCAQILAPTGIVLVFIFQFL